MKLYLTYSQADVAAQKAVLRLQALSIVNNVTTLLPAHSSPDENVLRIQQSDAVIGIVGASASQALVRELKAAKQADKPVILLCAPGKAAPNIPGFKADAVASANPDQIDLGQLRIFAQGVAQGVATTKAKQKETSDLLMGVLVVGLGIWALSKAK